MVICVVTEQLFQRKWPMGVGALVLGGGMIFTFRVFLLDIISALFALFGIYVLYLDLVKNRKGRQQEHEGDLNGYHSELNNDSSLGAYDTNEFVNGNHPSINIGELEIDTQLASKTAKTVATGIVCFDTISKFFAGVICLVIAMIFLIGGEIAASHT